MGEKAVHILQRAGGEDRVGETGQAAQPYMNQISSATP